jgi:hypothetical protein
LVNSPQGDFVADGNFTRTSISYALFGKCPLLDFTQRLLDLFFSIHHERIEIIERGKRKKGSNFLSTVGFSRGRNLKSPSGTLSTNWTNYTDRPGNATLRFSSASLTAREGMD